MSRLPPAAGDAGPTAIAIQSLQDQVSGRAGPVMLGARWRLRSQPWPTPASAECLLIENFRGTGWFTLAVLQPDGVWGGSE